jgi:uracil-DNA glycosylase
MDRVTFKNNLLTQLYEPYKQCLKCPLGFLGRKTVVFGEGNPDAHVLFIGEAPGKEEDEQGKPFVGRSGKLLNKALSQAGLDRSNVYISNVVKCRPPDNRQPTPIEIDTCTKLLLLHQIKIIEPEIICPLGAIALTTLLGAQYKITKTRGTIINKNQYIVIPSYHPSYVLRNQSQLSVFFQDIILIKEEAEKAK